MAEILAAWRAEPKVAPVFAAMERFGAGTALERCAPLAGLFGGKGTQAMDFVGRFVANVLAGLDAHPLGQLPMLHRNPDAAPLLVLASSGRASLSLVAYDGATLAELPAPRTVKFEPRETWTNVLVGSGVAEHFLRRDGRGDCAMLQSGRLALEPGMVLYRYGRREALQVRGANGRLVKLRLQRLLDDHEPIREFNLPDGTPRHEGAARPQDLRCELALALLGRMGRNDAVAQMSKIARGETDRSGGEGLRLQALREVLALDPAAGLELLATLANRAEDPLSRRAAALRASLLKSRSRQERTAGWPK